MLVDSHCHLNYKGLAEDIDGVLERGRAAGISYFLTINTKIAQYDEVLAIARAHDDVSATVGIHPHEAAAEIDVTTADIVARTAPPEIVGIGETGLDYYYDNAPRDAQREMFRRHIAAARETGLPLIVHSRDAEDDTTALLEGGLAEGPLTAIIHCFTGSRPFMERMVAMGFHISLSGIVTFKNARDLQETAKAVPADRLLVETDSPFLAPVPHRGKPCEPAYVADTARFLADLRGDSIEELTAQTTKNFFAIFRGIALRKAKN